MKNKASETYDQAALQVMHRLSRAIVTAPKLTEVCEKILREAVQMIPVRNASIMQYDPSADALRIVASIGIPKAVARKVRVPIGKGLSGQVFASSQPLLASDIGAVPGATGRKRYRGRSAIVAPVAAMPLQVGAQPLGVINMTDKRDGTPFTPQDLALIQTLANHTAAYMHICDLADTVAEARRLEQEMDIARSIQQGLLPHGSTKLSGLTVAGECLPSEHVGGDYFGYFSEPANAPGIAIADVAGHNIGAALTMASVRSILRAEMAHGEESLSDVMSHLNHHLQDDLMKAEQFISGVIVRYDRAMRTVRYCVAGHPMPLLVRRGRIQTLSKSTGTVLGAVPDAAFPIGTVKVERGDLLFLHTDGLTGVHGRRGGKFGLRRLRQCLTANANRSPKQVIGAIKHAIKAFSSTDGYDDDVTMVAMKVK